MNIHFNRCINAHQLISISVKSKWSCVYDCGTNSDQYIFFSDSLFPIWIQWTHTPKHFFPADKKVQRDVCEDFSLRKLMNSIAAVSDSFVLSFLFPLGFFFVKWLICYLNSIEMLNKKLSCDIQEIPPPNGHAHQIHQKKNWMFSSIGKMVYILCIIYCVRFSFQMGANNDKHNGLMPFFMNAAFFFSW